MTKTISISPTVMLALVAGASLKQFDVPEAKGSKIVRCSYHQASGEFLVEISNDKFDDPMAGRHPQTFILDTKK